MKSLPDEAPASASDKSVDKPKTSATKRTVTDHALARGYLVKGVSSIAIVMKAPIGAPAPVPSETLLPDPQNGWKHKCAAALHGWVEHTHHAGAAMELADADYDAAIAAVENPDAKGESHPHPAALSPFKGRGT